MTKFTFTYNDGKGEMTLNLENFFARNPTTGKLINTIKPDVKKVFKLIKEWCDEKQIDFLLNWLESNGCSDLATDFQKLR